MAVAVAVLFWYWFHRELLEKRENGGYIWRWKLFFCWELWLLSTTVRNSFHNFIIHLDLTIFNYVRVQLSDLFHTEAISARKSRWTSETLNNYKFSRVQMSRSLPSSLLVYRFGGFEDTQGIQKRRTSLGVTPNCWIPQWLIILKFAMNFIRSDRIVQTASWSHKPKTKY